MHEDSLESKILKAKRRRQRERMFSYAFLIFALAGFAVLVQIYLENQNTTEQLQLARNDVSRERERNNQLGLEFSRLEADFEELVEIQGRTRSSLNEAEMNLEKANEELASLQDIQTELSAASDEIRQLRAVVNAVENDAEVLDKNLLQRTFYVGDSADDLASNAVSFECSQVRDQPELEAYIENRLGAELTLVRLDLITTISGGTCGHTFYSAIWRATIPEN